MKLNNMQYKIGLMAALMCFTFSTLAQDVMVKNSQISANQMPTKDWTTLTCSGFKTWNDCRIQAHEICPNGFKTADSLENILIQRREVSVACKG